MPQLVGKEVGDIGFGLMGLTWRPNPTPTEEAIKAMRAALAHGANFWNGGELYGTVEYNSLHLLAKYFEKYPEDADKVVLSIKGGLKPPSLEPDASEQNLRRSVGECLKWLDGKKKVDLFEMARVDPKLPIEQAVETLGTLVKEGKIGGISLSEVKAETIRRAAKVHKISAVEVELSLWSTDVLHNGVAAACAEHNIPLIAYSPLGRGFLTGQIKKPEDIPEGDIRRHMPRFQPDAFAQNLKLVEELQQLAHKKGCTPAQLALGWVRQLSGKPGLPVIIPIPGATTVERIKENMEKVDLTDSEVAEIDAILKKIDVVGGRYGGPAAAYVEG